MKTEAGIGVMLPYAKECLWLLEAERGRKRQRQTVRETLAQENAERYRVCLKINVENIFWNLCCLHLELFTKGSNALPCYLQGI